jgi:hypothetical protein
MSETYHKKFKHSIVRTLSFYFMHKINHLIMSEIYTILTFHCLNTIYSTECLESEEKI